MNRMLRRHPLRAVAAGLILTVLGAFGLLRLASAHAPDGAVPTGVAAEGGPQAGPHGPRMHGPMHGPAAHGMPGLAGLPLGGPHMAQWLDAVGASTEQREQLRRIGDALHQDLAAARGAARQAALAEHEQMLDLLAAPQVDAQAVERLRLAGLARREAEGRALSQRMSRAMLDGAAVLSAEQRLQLVQRLRELHARHAAARTSPAAASQGR